MTTWNTTYNFNQPSMNFGQSFLYGAFGQLTGMRGGGCYGGGYGVGSYGMGMGGSLFSMMGGCGGYGGIGYGFGIPDSYVGAQCGLAATNVLFSVIGTHLTSRREARASATNIESAIDELRKKINNPENYVKTEDAALETAQNARTSKWNELNKAKSKVGPAQGEYDALVAEKDAILRLPEAQQDKDRLLQLGDDTKGLIKAKKDAWDKAVADEKKAQDEYDTSQQKVEEAELARQTAINKVVSTASEELEKKLEELKKLKGNTNEEFDNLKSKSHLMSEFAKAAKECNNILSDPKKTDNDKNTAKDSLLRAYNAIKDNTDISEAYRKMAEDKCKELGVIS